MSMRSQDLPFLRSREVPKLPVMSQWHHLKVKMIQAFPPNFSEAVEQNLGQKTWIGGYRTTT